MLNKHKLTLTIIAGIVAVGLYVFAPPANPPVFQPPQDIKALQSAFRDGKSGIWMELEGTVSRLLSEDKEGSRHQRFILEVGDRHTVLVSHNIDLVERVPVEVGDQLRLRGRYEWNKRGGVVHWTHRDPKQKIQGGWIEHQGKRYK